MCGCLLVSLTTISKLYKKYRPNVKMFINDKLERFRRKVVVYFNVLNQLFTRRFYKGKKPENTCPGRVLTTAMQVLRKM